MKRRIIIVTDGDRCAREAIEVAVKRIGGRCISMSGGNPSKIKGEDLISLIKMSKNDPVVVMVDDKGNNGLGAGEKIIEELFSSSEVVIIGIVAVASNTRDGRGIKVNCSIDRFGNIINNAVDKNGKRMQTKLLKGDTVNSLDYYSVPYIVGIGDPGKMDGYDDIAVGAPIMTKALECILKNNKRNPFPS